MDYDNMKYNGSTDSDQNKNANGISATLSQGLQFQKYLKKISGFGDEQGVSIEPYQNMSQEEKKQKVAELAALKTEYIALVNNFEGAGNTLRTGYSAYLSSTSRPSSTYTNQHVTFAGQTGYVTKNGVFKTYTNGATFNGVNGCPSTSNRIIVNGTLSTILSSNGLTQGAAMQDGQSCGNEGSNVFVTKTIDSGITYNGCYQASDPTLSAMQLQPGGPIFNVNSCKWRAVNTGAAIFALRNYDASSNRANCYTGATFVSPTLLGNTYIEKNLLTSETTPIASSITFTTPYQMKLLNGGFISIVDNGGRLVKQIPNTGKSSCKIVPEITNLYVPPAAGAIASNFITGANKSAVNLALNPLGLPSFSFTIKQLYDALKTDIPTPATSYVLKYTSNGIVSAAITINTDATKNATDIIDIPPSLTSTACDSHIILKDNGNMEVYAGLTPPTTGTPDLFARLLNNVTDSVSISDSTLQRLYPSCVNLTGTNSMSSTLSLPRNHYIKSNNGKLVLMMQMDGNLCLKTFTKKYTCTTSAVDTQTYGGADAYSIYNFNNPMDNSNIGKLAYIDDEGLSHAYPASMITREPNNYQRFMNYDSVGNNIANMPIQNSNNNYCRSASDALETSGGYVYDNNTKNCWIKNSSLTLSTPKTYVEGSYLNVKTPIPMVPASCSDTITEIDSNRWKQYKTSSAMTPSFSCGPSRRYSSAQINVRSIEEQLNNMAIDILGRMNELQSQGVTLSADMNTFKKQLQVSINTHKQNNSASYVESDNVLNSALSGMMSDVDLMVLRENSRYLFLSIFAIGALVVALNSIKK